MLGRTQCQVWLYCTLPLPLHFQPKSHQGLRLPRVAMGKLEDSPLHCMGGWWRGKSQVKCPHACARQQCQQTGGITRMPRTHHIWVSCLSPFSLALERSLASCLFSSKDSGLEVEGWMPDLGKRHRKYCRTDSSHNNKLLRAIFMSDPFVSTTSLHSHNPKRSVQDLLLSK